MTKTVYIKVRQLTRLAKKEVLLGDIADILSEDKAVEEHCRKVKIKTIQTENAAKYIGSITDVTELLLTEIPGIEICSLGEPDYIIAYDPKPSPSVLRQWGKTAFCCLISFTGAAFAIMTFNNDASVLDVFGGLYQLVMGRESDGLTVLEFGYSLGLAAGILLFFNHFAQWKLSTDPTPLEVEMRLYDKNLNQTLIQNEERREEENDAL